MQKKKSLEFLPTILYFDVNWIYEILYVLQKEKDSSPNYKFVLQEKYH